MPNGEQPTNEKPKGNMLQNENGPEDETPSAPGTETAREKKNDADKQHSSPNSSQEKEKH